MDLALSIALVVVMVVSVAAVAVVFIWAAKRDGEEDKALQKRLGIKRKTRLGR